MTDNFSATDHSGLMFWQMKVEPAVVKIDFEVTVSGQEVLVHDINSYGAKAFFFLSFDDEPPFALDYSDVKDGSEIVTNGYLYTTSFTIPGEYTVTGNIAIAMHCNIPNTGFLKKKKQFAELSRGPSARLKSS